MLIFVLVSINGTQLTLVFFLFFDGGLFGRTVMWKPREFAHLIRNRFGSADNINNISRNGDAVAAAAAGISTASASTGVAAPTGEDTYPGPAAALTPGQSNSLPGHGSQVIVTYN